jgi:type VI secretion system protein ImpJ
VVRSLTARLRDGTLVAVPEDGVLAPVELKNAFERGNTVMVFLAVPTLQPGRANVAGNGTGDAVRYLLDTQELQDENTGADAQEIQVRLLNVKLLLHFQDKAGFDVLPIARISRAATADALPQIDLNYIPPILACDGWQPLQAGILQVIYDRFGKKLEQLSTQVVSRSISFDTRNQGDLALLTQLQMLNEGYALLNVLAFAEGVHPLAAYLELCRLVGLLAIFGKSRRTPTLPKYNHDDLAGCFYKVKQYLDDLYPEMPIYEERPFIGAGLQMQVAMESKWLQSNWQMYIGVLSPLSADECVRLLTKPGQLDMKIGSSARVNQIYDLGQAGLRFTHSPTPSRALPSPPGLVYFQVAREAQLEEWLHVQKSLTLAIRLNERRIVGNIQGQRVLTIQTGGQPTTLQFTLYLLPQEG